MDAHTKRMRLRYSAVLITYFILYLVCLGLFLSIDLDTHGVQYLREAGIQHYIDKTNATSFSPDWLQRIKPPSEVMAEYL